VFAEFSIKMNYDCCSSPVSLAAHKQRPFLGPGIQTPRLILACPLTSRAKRQCCFV